ncbi:MAG: flagellar FliJ family protein [Bacteroidota bacterium]
MAKPAKGLKTLIRLSKFNVDEKRRALTALQAREDEVLAEIQAAEDQLVHEQQLATANAETIGFAFPRFYQAWAQRRHSMEQALIALRQQIEQARDELAEAFREQKTYEVTQANREKREREEADRKEQIFLDEVGLTMHRRKGEQQAADDAEEEAGG